MKPSKQKYQMTVRSLLVYAIVAWVSCFLVLPAHATETTGCIPGGSKHYSAMDASDFSHLDDSVQIDSNQHLVLDTGQGRINTNRIIVTSTQEIRVSFLYEGAGYVSHFGYFLLSKAKSGGYVDSLGTTINYSQTKAAMNPSNASYDPATFHHIFKSISDDAAGGDGVLDVFSGRSEAYVAAYNDGTGIPFAVNGDGQLTARDMTKSLGLIGEGEELVFFLVANGNYDQVFFSKDAYNQDTYSGGCSGSSFTKIYHLGQARIKEGTCQVESGWLSTGAFNRLSSVYGITLNSEDEYIMQITRGSKFPHVIVGAPADDPTQWVLGWEDLWGGGDTDHNDMVFKVQRKTEGRAISKVVSDAVVAIPNTYITAVNIEVTDLVKNCVSGVVSSLNIPFSTGDFSGGWDYAEDALCVSTSQCTVGCASADFSGSLTASNLTVSGSINDDFNHVDLLRDTAAWILLSFSNCHQVLSGSTLCGPYSQPSFYNANASVRLSGQDINVNSSGGFSGSAQVSAAISETDEEHDSCFQNWEGSLNKTATISGQLNGDWNTRKNDIRYSISVDDGQTWVEVDRWESEIENEDGTRTRGARIDVLSRGLVGNKLKWKAVFENNDDHCDPPEIHEVSISYEASGNNFFSRATPIVLGNVLYSGSLETPAASWTDKTTLRGHMNAYRIYDPNNPIVPSYSSLWDAGQVLSQRNLTSNPRTIYTALPTPEQVENTSIATGDGHTISFSGTLAHGRILAGSLVITDGTEIFQDQGVASLIGDKGGGGTIDRFTGSYALTFHSAPAEGVPVFSSYKYYPNVSGAQTLGQFSADYVTNEMLGITNQYVQGVGYTYDLNGDGSFSDLDRLYAVASVHGFLANGSQQAWPLGAIDHSTPALAGPPALPAWYYGIDISQDERDAFDAWSQAMKGRRTVLYVGSRSGMLHAFDAGKFQHGDNPATSFMENRGYFGSTDSAVDYGTGEELWAFIPNNCVSRLKHLVKRNLANADPPYVDASPSIEDVFYTEGGETIFKTLLFSAEGNGGDTVFALDITDPYHPAFLWEYANPDLWRSKSSPPIGKVARLNSGGQAKWVVFFVSGQTAADHHPSVFMVDALTGTLLSKIVLDQAGNANLGAILSGSPAILDANGNGYIDRFYVGDDKGFMYRVNIPDQSQAVLDVNQIMDCVLVQVSEPIYASPTVYPQNTYDSQGYVADYHVKIMFGTGDNPNFIDNPNYAGTRYKFYVFDDTCHPLNAFRQIKDNDNISCNCSPMQTEADAVWTYTLPAGHRIWAEAFAAAGTVYFGTATSDTEDPCTTPTTGDSYGNVYSLDLNNLTADTQVQTVATNIGNVNSLVVEDQHLYVKATKPTSGTTTVSFGNGIYNNDVAVGSDFDTKKVQGSWRQAIP